MGVNYLFRDVGSVEDLNRLRDHLLIQPLHYPEYEKWVIDRCIPELESGFKKVILGFYYDNLIGDIIFQEHKQLPRTCELKNMRINPNFRDKDIGHFLIRQAEEEAKRSGKFDRVILDIDSEETGIKKFLMFCNYNILFQAPLYGKRLDIIMGKELFQNNLRNYSRHSELIQ